MIKKGGIHMLNELETKIRNLRSELTQLVRDGLDEDGLILRRMLADLERLERQRFTLSSQAATNH
jgi:hypothetical protein